MKDRADYLLKLISLFFFILLSKKRGLSFALRIGDDYCFVSILLLYILYLYICLRMTTYFINTMCSYACTYIIKQIKIID
jgi:hypothetical protein